MFNAATQQMRGRWTVGGTEELGHEATEANGWVWGAVLEREEGRALRPEEGQTSKQYRRPQRINNKVAKNGEENQAVEECWCGAGGLMTEEEQV